MGSLRFTQSKRTNDSSIAMVASQGETNRASTVFTYVMNLTNFRIRAMRRILAILTTRITHAFELAAAPS
jgi:hypothetical protein